MGSLGFAVLLLVGLCGKNFKNNSGNRPTLLDAWPVVGFGVEFL